MALKNYNVVVNGTETILQLDDRDAKARGLTDKDLVGAESSAPAGDAGKKAAAAPANKGRTPANK